MLHLSEHQRRVGSLGDRRPWRSGTMDSCYCPVLWGCAWRTFILPSSERAAPAAWQQFLRLAAAERHNAYGTPTSRQQPRRKMDW